MHGRWFAKRQLEADWYDGLTDYKVAAVETEVEQKKRLDEFGDWLENQSDNDEDEEDEDL